MKLIAAVLVGVFVLGHPAVGSAKEKTAKTEEKAVAKADKKTDAKAKTSSGKIEKDKKVTLQYSLTVDGAVVDASTPEKPFQYVQGTNAIIKGLEAALEGMKVGDSKKVTVEPKDAYGEVNPQAFMAFPKSKVPEGVDVKKGQVIGLTNEKKQQIKGVVWDFKDDKIILNMNHPLAGKTLNFDVKVVAIE